MKNEISAKNIFLLSAPAMFYYATVMLVGIVDILFIGQLGTVAIAAASIGVSICTAIYAFLDGIRTSTSVLTAQFLGAQDDNGIKQTLTSSLFSSLFLGIAILPLIPYFSTLIFRIIGNPEIQELGTSYLYIRLLSMPFLLATFSAVGFFRGLYNVSMQLIVAVTISISNIILDYCWIYGKFGFPALGVKGAALATLTAEGLGAILALSMLFGHKLTRSRISFALPNLALFKKYAKIGTESGLYNGFTYLAISMFALLFSTLGTQTLAVNQIGSQLFFISYLPQQGLFVAMSIIAGKLLGSRSYDFIVPAVFRVGAIAIIVSAFLGGVILIFARPIISLFSPGDPSVVEGVLAILLFICLDQVVSAGIVILKGALTGVNDTRFITIVMALSGYGFFLPLAYFFGFNLKLGLVGGYIAYIVWSTVDLFIFSIRLYVIKKRLCLTPTPIQIHNQTSTQQANLAPKSFSL